MIYTINEIAFMFLPFFIVACVVEKREPSWFGQLSQTNGHLKYFSDSHIIYYRYGVSVIATKTQCDNKHNALSLYSTKAYNIYIYIYIYVYHK